MNSFLVTVKVQSLELSSWSSCSLEESVVDEEKMGWFELAFGLDEPLLFDWLLASLFALLPFGSLLLADWYLVEFELDWEEAGLGPVDNWFWRRPLIAAAAADMVDIKSL